MKLKLFLSSARDNQGSSVDDPGSTGRTGSERAYSNLRPNPEKGASSIKLSPGERERWRKCIAKYASPSCIKKNGCKVKTDLEGPNNRDGLRIRYEVSLLVKEFMRANRTSLTTWISDLSNDGLAVIPNVFFTEEIQKDADDLLRAFRCSQNMMKSIDDPEESFWVHVTNAAREDPKTHLRYMARKGGYLWLKRLLPEKLKVKHKVDLYLASLVESMGILGTQEQYEISRYGSTLLLSLPGCAEQVPHTDYCWTYFKYTTDRRPAYFLMFGGPSEMKLNVWRGSHLTSITRIPEELQEQLGKTLKKEVLYITPHAVVVSRGDLVHSGTSYPETEKMASVRYHLTFDREDLAEDDLFQLREEYTQGDEGNLMIVSSGSRKRRSPSNSGRNSSSSRSHKKRKR